MKFEDYKTDERLQAMVDCDRTDSKRSLWQCIDAGCAQGCDDFEDAVREAGVPRQLVDDAMSAYVPTLRHGGQVDPRAGVVAGSAADDSAEADPTSAKEHAEHRDDQPATAPEAVAAATPIEAEADASDCDGPAEKTAPTDEPPVNADVPQRERATWNVDDLKPNAINGDVFTTSLSEASIEQLAENMALHGLRQPIEIRPDGVILDGERRWRAAQLLGWDEVDVVVVRDVSDADVAAYVLDAFSSTRDATIEEKVALYGLALSVLKERHGRRRGRPEKTVQIDTDFWSREKVQDEAARMAGFTSASLAVRARSVFESDNDEVKADLLAGGMSITAAYDAIRPGASQLGPEVAEERAPACTTTAGTQELEEAEDASAGANESTVAVTGTENEQVAEPEDQIGTPRDDADLDTDGGEILESNADDATSTAGARGAECAQDSVGSTPQSARQVGIEDTTAERGAEVIEKLSRVATDIASCLEVVEGDGVEDEHAVELKQRFEAAMSGFGKLGMRLHERGVV